MKSSKKARNVTVLANGKKALTKQVIDYDFLHLKTSLFEYLAILLLIIALIAFSYYFNPVCYIFLIAYPFIIIDGIKKDIRYRQLKYFRLDGVCETKDIKDDHKHYLWLSNPEVKNLIPIAVDKKVYDKVNIKDEFYLVVASGAHEACLCYSKNEWELTETIS